MFDTLVTIGLLAGVLLASLVAIGLVLSRLYHRASKEISFVRTGFGGQKVVMNGGALVFPVLHEIIPVNMNTLRLEVRRANEAALITRDRMRVDVQAEFYVRVKPTLEAIADAAQTLGRRTIDPKALKELVEGKFVDSLRAVAAEMTMEDLHENRVNFVQKVQVAVTEDLLKNGLELETVSLTSLDQTDQSFFNPQNAFDAQGLTKLTEEIQARRKQRNDIEQDTEVAVRQKNLEAERLKLNLAREEEYARLMQQREVAVRRADENASIALEEAEKERVSQEARIGARQRVDQAQIEAERAVEEQRIEKERLLREREIQKARSLETAEIERKKTVELAEQVRAIAVAAKSQEQSTAEADANRALSLAVKTEEEVVTVREREKAERLKVIDLVEAAKVAEREAIGLKVAADAQKAAALDRAEAIRIEAQAAADKVRLEAEAAERKYAVDASGRRQLNEADNLLSSEQIAMRIRLSLIERLDEIIRESVKPLERIEGIRIVQVEGLNGGASAAAGAGAGEAGSGNLADQVVNSALRYRSQAPLLDSLLREIGVDAGSLNGMTEGFRAAPIVTAPAGDNLQASAGDKGDDTAEVEI